MREAGRKGTVSRRGATAEVPYLRRGRTVPGLLGATTQLQLIYYLMILLSYVCCAGFVPQQGKKDAARGWW
jgi:hypothetical protein